MSDVLSEAFEAGQHPSGPGFLTFGTDRRLMVRFFTLPVLQPYQSNTAGRPVYVGQDMIEVRQPGERDAVIRPAMHALDLQPSALRTRRAGGSH